MTKHLQINCDLGEGFGAWSMGQDSALMPLIDCANIACGFHAGDATIMRETLLTAKQSRVEIGAHVAYPDLQGFGRRSMNIHGQALIDLIHYQISALDGMARTLGTKVSYVKPHGALYNDMMADPKKLNDVMAAAASWYRSVDLVVLATGKDRKTTQLAVEHGLSLRFEAFADRGYDNDGQLLPRGTPGAVLTQDQAVAQAQQIAGNRLRSVKGKKLSLKADTLCVHGDTPGALTMIKAIREALA